MKHRPMALTIALNSALMIFSVYLLMQTFVYFRDGILMGTGDMSDFIPVVFGFLGNRVLPPMVVFGIILWALARPIEKVWNRLEKGEILTPEEAEKVRIRILRFKFIVLGINIFGFTIGFILNLVFSGNLNSVTQLNYAMILVSNLTGAFVFSAAQTALNNVVFAPVRDKLNIFAIQGRKKDAPSTTRQLRLSLALVVYSLLVVQYNQYDVTLFQSWGQEILQQVQTGSLSAPEAEKAYREIIQSRFSLISMRSPDLAAASPLPWEGAMPGPVKQQMVFLLLGMMMGMISLSVQYAVSREQRSTILALHGRIKDVVEGQGDLKSRISLRSLDDMGELGEMVNRLLDQFRSMVTTIAGAARQTRSSSRSVEEVLVEAENVAHQVGEAVTSLRQELEAQVTQSQNLTQTLLAFRNSAVEVEAETSVQDQYLTQTAAAMAEMDSNIVQVRDSSREAENLTKTLADQGLAGGEAVKATSQAIQNVLTSSSEIQQFLTVLNQIAANTNLLAMNAAIEAAHAGEKGAGFAVVADEVRKLAQTSGVQTKSIKELLKNMARLVEGGVEKARISGSVLEDLVQGLQDSAQVSRKVSESMEEQTSRTREVASSLDQVVRAGQSISRKVTRQLETTRDMEESLTRAVGKLNLLTEGSIRQSQAMGTLDRTFLQVRKEVEANAKAAESLEKELSRFQV